MGWQDEMEEMESLGNKGRGETLVCRDHLARKVHMLFIFEQRLFYNNCGSPV